jgi:hypothetical protein
MGCAPAIPDPPARNEESADMNTALKTVTNDGRPSRTRLVVLDAQQQVIRLLAENPGVRERNPERVLYFATEAAELDELGTMAALIGLKLSEHPQFQDRPGACKLIETAAKRGDQAAARRLSECRAN